MLLSINFTCNSNWYTHIDNENKIYINIYMIHLIYNTQNRRFIRRGFIGVEGAWPINLRLRPLRIRTNHYLRPLSHGPYWTYLAAG